MKKYILLVCVVLFLAKTIVAQSINITTSTQSFIELEIKFDTSLSFKDTVINGRQLKRFINRDNSLTDYGKPDLPVFFQQIGVPYSSVCKLYVISEDYQLHKNFIVKPKQENIIENTVENNYDSKVYLTNDFYPQKGYELSTKFSYRDLTIQPIILNQFQYNPVTRTLKENKSVFIRIEFDENVKYNNSIKKSNDALSSKFATDNLLNPVVAKSFIKKKEYNSIQTADWYSPNKTYHKIYVSNNDVYKISYEYLLQNNVISGPIDVNKIELINNGESVKVEMISGQNEIFEPGDYFRFVGVKPTPTPNSSLNIYNNSNIYWLSVEGTLLDSYPEYSGFPNNTDSTFSSIWTTKHFEVDSLYERLGHAHIDSTNDNWYWGTVSGSNGSYSDHFSFRFNVFDNLSSDERKIEFKANLVGLTTKNCSPDHHAIIKINNVELGDITWDGQNKTTFAKSYYYSGDSIPFFSTGNYARIYSDGIVCNGVSSDDKFLVNWIEMSYYRRNRASVNNYFFSIKSPTQKKLGFKIWQWERNSFKAFVPSKNYILKTPYQNLAAQSLTFADTVSTQADYYCVADDYGSNVDSIKLDKSSNLQNQTGADYLIITHKNFTEAANRLSAFRSNNLDDFTNPRVLVVDVQDIYDEFSFGLLNPQAIQDYIKYAYNNDPAPALSYVALLGDMSYDYRGLLKSSRPNFIPSMPYKAYRYGEAASDNNFATVVGDDIVPDISIGRISCETLEEANILVDKIISYPSDDSKAWRQKALLIGAGQDEQDENSFGFNESNIRLENLFIKPNGFIAEKVFRYPNKPEHQRFKGNGPEIREYFKKGVAVANFYGHGGGQQWDLVFLNDDINLLENGGKLPVVLSPTCYTGHFENQDVFGEKWIKIPDKGAIGFWGNTGLTFYNFGKHINELLFDQIYDKKEYTIGKAILKAKVAGASTAGSRIGRDNLALLSYLGDPAIKLALPDKPDFQVNENEIVLNPENPIKGDTNKVKVIVKNLGTISKDTTLVKLFDVSENLTIIDSANLPPFAVKDSVYFNWAPDRDGSLLIRTTVNDSQEILEMDFADNKADKQVTVFNISEPSLLYPVNGQVINSQSLSLKYVDISIYLNFDVKYYIQVDTSQSFINPILSSNPDGLRPVNGIVKWDINNLNDGIYYFRARLKNGEEYTNWTNTSTFIISSENTYNVKFQNNQLEMFNKNNVVFNSDKKGLELSNQFYPPKPTQDRLIDTVDVGSISSKIKLTVITTDGQYIYIGNSSYYNNLKPSAIYKLGTGNNSVLGQVYDSIPNLKIKLTNSIFHYNGSIYAATSDAYSLLKINPITGDTVRVRLNDGMLNKDDGKVSDGSFYLKYSDGYVYNLSQQDSATGTNNFIIRKIDPVTWLKVGEDILTSSYNMDRHMSDFFLADGFVFPSEKFAHGEMRRIRLNDGYFEEEFNTGYSFLGLHAWCYDSVNDLVYSTIEFPGKESAVVRYYGKYQNTKGVIESPVIGPANSWEKIQIEDDITNYSGSRNCKIVGFNKTTNVWDTLYTNISGVVNLSEINSELYSEIKLLNQLNDPSLGTSGNYLFKSLAIDYTPSPELLITPLDITYAPDSVLQGHDYTVDYSIRNLGYSEAGNAKISIYENGEIEPLQINTFNLKADSSVTFSHTFPTSHLLFDNFIKAKIIGNEKEFFTFNNTAISNFYVARDSTNPDFKVEFDGVEILTGDLVSTNPRIKISLKDNSPLPLDTANFFIYVDNNPISFSGDSVKYTYIPYPNSEGIAEFKKDFDDGQHIIEVLAKDASGNYFDTTSYRVSFNVNSKNDILDIYNYPNPFGEETHFTFNLTGTTLPEKVGIKIFTVAGRLIKVIDLNSSQINFGFNKIYWNGRDEDGDAIANGVYFYKISVLNNGELKTQIKKLAKVQ